MSAAPPSLPPHPLPFLQDASLSISPLFLSDILKKKKSRHDSRALLEQNIKNKMQSSPIFFHPFISDTGVDIQAAETLLIAKRSTTNRHNLNQQGNKCGHFEMLGVDDSIHETHSSKRH